MMFEVDREEVASVLDRVVADLLEAAGVAGPPVDAIALARKHLGMEVCLDSRQPQRGRAQRLSGRRQIFVRPEPTAERQQWTVAHEIAEHLKPTILERLGLDAGETRPMAGESLANLFAPRLLAPTRFLAADAPALGHDLLQLKERYATASHEVLALRLLDLAEPCIIAIVDNDHVHRRRSNAWPVNKQLSPAERECQRYVNYYSRPRLLQENGWTVQGWPVHQADWKREILRSVVESE